MLVNVFNLECMHSGTRVFGQLGGEAKEPFISGMLHPKSHYGPSETCLRNTYSINSAKNDARAAKEIT